jgi:hypothetical protein
MKTSAEKSSTTSKAATQAAYHPFFAKAGGGEFFAPATRTAVPAVQLKLVVNKPGDKFEQEADKMADKVMRMPTPASPVKEEKSKLLADDRLQKAAKPEEKIQKKEKPEEKIQKAPATEEKLQRKGSDGAPAASANVQAAIQNKTTGGQPLASDVRSYMEPRFCADFGNVQVHSDPESAKLSNQISARAFTYQNHVFFSRDQYQPGTSEGKQLLAHELTHTIQQGYAVQRSPVVSTTTTPPQIQRSVVGEILDWFADKANYIPGFRMFTIVLGVNPINMSTVDRSPANILRALIEFMPGGAFITTALDNHGVFNKVGAWLENQIKALGMVGQLFKSALSEFIDSLGWSDLAPWNWGDVWNRAKRIFTAPIDRLISFAKGVVRDIIKFIKDAILKPLAALAQGTRGYDLLKAILGEDPITGEPVPRNADTLIGGFMKLIGQEDIWENIKKGKAIARAWAWFQGALSGLMGFVRSIPRKIIDTLTSLTIQDIITVAGAFTKVVGAFVNIATEFLSWGLKQVISLLEILFSVVAPGVMPYIKKAQAAFMTILKNPIGFVGNLVRAGKLGFEMFASRIGEHLKAALIKWIVGPLADAGVYIPKSFSLLEIVKLVLSVLGLTWQNIRGKLVKIIPEPVLAGLEKTASILVTLVKDGPAAAWEEIKAELSELKDQLIAQITQMVTTEVVKAAVMKLVSMLNPAGAVIQAIIAIYNTVTFFIQKIQQIAAVVASFIDSIAAIAAGQVTNAAKKVEQTMANTLTIIIAFLAKFAGLGNIPEKLVGIVKKIRQPIDKGLDKIVAWLGNMLKKAGAAVVDWWNDKLGFSNKDGESHTLQFIGTGDAAKMGIATTLTPIRTYLDNHPDKGTADWNTADSVFSAAMQVVFSPAAKNQAEKDRRSAIKQQLAKVSSAFARLAGTPPTADDYGKNTPPTYGNPAKVEVIVGNPLTGSITGPWPTTKPGYKEIYDAGLTTATDKWVQMHIISEKLGGSGTDFSNLVPAPHSVNTGPFRSFEHSTAALAKAKTGNIKNRVWVEVLVSGSKSAATGLSGKAGLYFWKGKKASPKWMKSESPSFTANAGIPTPQLSATRKLVLNFTSGTEMRKDFGLSSAVATLVKEGRPYASQEKFVESMKKRGALTMQINAVLSRSPVLNGP